MSKAINLHKFNIVLYYVSQLTIWANGAVALHYTYRYYGSYYYYSPSLISLLCVFMVACASSTLRYYRKLSEEYHRVIDDSDNIGNHGLGIVNKKN